MRVDHGLQPRNPYNMIIQENHAASKAYLYYIILEDNNNLFLVYDTRNRLLLSYQHIEEINYSRHAVNHKTGE